KSLSDQSAAKIERALDSIRPDCEYSDWIKVGQAIYAESAGSSRGMALWESWSIRGKKHEINECAVKWGTFSVEGVSIGGAHLLAADHGAVNFLRKEGLNLRKQCFTESVLRGHNIEIFKLADGVGMPRYGQAIGKNRKAN
ncbi:MAG: hypothetical protein HOA45_11845, partial [Verrucomicrobia bacterium]|nr:hypothetical protein [Verrucomicrobiota bacterium]